MRILKVLPPAALVVAVAAGLSGCGSATSSSAGNGTAGTPAPAGSSSATPATSSTSSPTAGGIDDPVYGWKGSSKEARGAEGSCAWLTTAQIKGVLGDLAPKLSSGVYGRNDYPPSDAINPGGTSWGCAANLGPEGSRVYVVRQVFTDVAHAKEAVKVGQLPVAVPGVGEEAYNVITTGSAGFWRVLAVRTGTTEVDVALRIGSDPKNAADVPNRIDLLLALYRMLPQA